MNAIRELLEFIAEQAVAADLGRRLLQDEVAARRRAEREVAILRDKLTKLETAIEEQGQEAMRQMGVAGSGFGEVTTCDA